MEKKQRPLAIVLRSAGVLQYFSGLSEIKDLLENNGPRSIYVDGIRTKHRINSGDLDVVKAFREH